MKLQCFRFYIALFFVFALFAVHLPVQAQETQKALKYTEKAEMYFQQGKWEECEKELKKAIEADPGLSEPYIMLGSVCLQSDRPSEAVDLFIKALDRNPDRKDLLLNLLGNTLFSLERYTEAVGIYDALLQISDIRAALRLDAEEMRKSALFRKSMMDYPVSFNPVNLGASINTEADEYINALMADRSGIYFTRRVRSGAGDARKFNEDLYFAAMHGDSAGQVDKINYPPGKDKDAGGLSISADGRLLVFTACFRADSYGSCDLYYSEKTGDIWSPAKNLGRMVNSASWDAQPSIAPDGRTLYFVSNRPGGSGSSDIWKTDRSPDGNWNQAVNPGRTLNTAAAEMGPFIHFDNQSLYFSSSGHEGMGGADLFRSTRVEGKWTIPENLGYPINTSSDELVVIINAEGNKGFISRNDRAGQGGYDIYMFDLYDSIRPVPVSYLKGKVYDSETGRPLQADFQLVDISRDSIIIDALSDKQSGEFLVCLPHQRQYALNVSCDGYLFYSEHFPMNELKNSLDPFEKDIPLEPLAVGKTIVLRNIFYETGKYQLQDKSFTELNRLVEFLAENPGLRAEIGGHTDNIGSEEDNIILSLNRAEAVYSYLTRHGIASDRITFKGYGESEPVSFNDTVEGRALNRRTEITIIE